MVMRAKDVSSLPCPKCGGKLKVTDSRPNMFWGMPSIRRKRVCLDCEHRYSTYEISLDALDEFAGRLRTIAREMVSGERFMVRNPNRSKLSNGRSDHQSDASTSKPAIVQP